MLTALTLFAAAAAASPAAQAAPAAQFPLGPPRAIGDDDQAFCAAMTVQAARAQRLSGAMIDSSTRWDGLTIDCNTRTLTWNKTVVANPSSVREGWEGRVRREFNDMICLTEDAMPAVRRGWRIEQVMTFAVDGTKVVHRADCG